MNVEQEAPELHPELQAAIKGRLQPIIEQVMDSYGLAGLAIGIVKDKKPLYAQGFGVRDVTTGEAVTPQTLFHLASISKPFSATAIMQMVERGLVDLDAPIVTYLPYFRLDDKRYGEVTVQQMLSHTAGMPNTWEFHWHLPEYDEGALERYVRGLAKNELIHAPGEKYDYSNAAYEVLGDLIAKVAGQPFESYIKQQILKPLQMENSTFLRQEVRRDWVTTPHFGMPLMTLEDTYPYHRAHAPSSTLHSNVIEMSQWAIANLNRGEFQGKRILQPQSYEQLWHRYVETGEEVWGEAVGLSWFFGSYGGHEVIHHGGSDPGFQAELVLLPAQGDAVIVMTNSNSAGAAVVMDATLDLLLGLEEKSPKRSIAVPIVAMLKAQGMEAAIAEYRRLQVTEPEAYDFGAGRFMDIVWGAIESHKPEGVMDLLYLWLALQPETSEVHEMLGWAYQVKGNNGLAAPHLQRALELDPENVHAAFMMKQIDA